MLLNISKIIEAPGTVRFDTQFHMEEFDFGSIVKFITPLNASGYVVNSADVLTLHAALNTKALCLCDRCGDEYIKSIEMNINAALGMQLQDEENPDIFSLTGDCVDLKEVVTTSFILDLDTKFLCKEDCGGLCQICGKNLNLGPCNCEKETDPRLAVLSLLLDNQEDLSEK